MAEGLDQGSALHLVQLLLPCHLLQVLLLWNIGGRVALGIDPKMLDPDVGTWQVEVGLIGSFLRRSYLMLIETFILILDAIEVEEVGNLAFLEALDSLSLQRSDFVSADVVVILAPGHELVWAAIRWQTVP